MDDEARQAIASMPMPNRPINYVPAQAGEILKLGHVTCRILEDGSRTDNRIGSAEFTLPPHTAGPPAHWHEMHDETFLVTAGVVRFHAADGTYHDAATGDYVTVPIRAPHTFSNPGNVEARFFNTYTPACYIGYIKALAELSQGDGKMSREKNLAVMSRFATIPAPGMKVEAE